MSEYELKKINTLDIDAFLAINPSIKDIFTIDGIEDADNISLLNARCKYLYSKVIDLEARLKSLERIRR